MNGPICFQEGMHYYVSCGHSFRNTELLLELRRARTTWNATDIEAQGQQSPPGRITAFFWGLLFPPPFSTILQHRSIGPGNAWTSKA